VSDSEVNVVDSIDTVQTTDIQSYVEEMPEPGETKRRPAELIAGENAVEGILLEQIIEGALLTAGKPLMIADLGALFEDDERPSADSLRAALAAINERYAGRGFELREVASGFRFQVVQNVAPWIARMWEEKPQRYSRALLETLALIAYRQPITRGDIEDIRGVAVASNIVKTLLEREWVRVVGHKDVPGRPAMYATTRKFLDYFNLKNLDDLPALAEIRDLDTLNAELSLEGADTPLPDVASELTDNDNAAADDAEAIDAEAVFNTDNEAEPVTETETAIDPDHATPSALADDSDIDAETDAAAVVVDDTEPAISITADDGDESRTE
jgi:segregation and condensation protein B